MRSPEERPRVPHVHVVITTYNRPDMLQRLLRQVFAEDVSGRLTIDVFDDASDQDYAFLEAYQNVTWFRRRTNGGKSGFWHLYQSVVSRVREVDADYVCSLQDDAQIVPGGLQRAISQYEAIDDPQRAGLNLHVDPSRQGEPCWTGVRPVVCRFGQTSVVRTQWTDLLFLANSRFFEALEFRIDPVPATRWYADPSRSSGVGEQISRRLHRDGFHLYQVSDSLVWHGDHPTQLHRPPSRPNDDPVIGGVATIPERLDSLSRMVDSILPQLDELHVYLNGFSDVPECLQRLGICCHLAQDHAGDRSDAGKFWQAGRSRGYYFSLDDDLHYPPHYVQTLIQAIEAHGRKAAVGLHGIRLRFPVQSYFRDRRVLHFGASLAQDAPVHLLGTGTAAFHTDTFRLSIADFPEPHLADLWFGLAAQRQQVPLIALQRPRGWVQQLPVKESLFDRFRNRDERQTALINTLPSWTLWGSSPDAEAADESAAASRYASHLPLLRFLIDYFRPSRVLEFGMGQFSTPLLVGSGADVTSIETDAAWLERSRQDDPRHRSILWPDDDVHAYLGEVNDDWDLAFVDGPQTSRVLCVERLLGRAKLIVIHDSLTRCYGWHRLRLPAEYGRVDDCRRKPATSVISRCEEDLDVIRQHCQLAALSGGRT